MAMKSATLEYDVGSYNFPGIIREALGVADLTLLHNEASYPVLTRETDQSTIFHKRLYTMGDRFYQVYRRLLTELIEPFIGQSIIYQRIPTFRVHLPGNVAVGEFHRDRDYRHRDGEINFWLPVTDAWDTNTIWIESDPGECNYRPRPCRVGQILTFDGVNLSHGNKLNETGSTRVSFDFRIIPLSDYVDSDLKSVNTGVEMSIGGYFGRL
jgi:hypothetical protein